MANQQAGTHEPFTIGTPEGCETTVSFYDSDLHCIGSRTYDGGLMVVVVPLPRSFYLRVSMRVVS